MQWGLTIGSVYFNSIDIIVFALAIIGGIADTLVGFADAFSHRSGYIVGFFSGLMFTKIIADIVSQSFALPLVIASLLSFIVLFLIGYALMRIVGNLLETALNATGLKAVNGLLGFLWGVIEVVIAASVIIYILELQEVFDLSAVFDASQFVLNIVRPLVPDTVHWFASSVQVAHV
ncbi:MAG: CvpA family protein [Sphaerochaeta sp.]|jgi:membrane protein required for colicin V production|uniref:CvpA family protein n=1 Tax=Sphaerochaeta sp. TaxID=1972642 RepID=UPI001DC219ED|nr:CvpA family protein [uncultured Sphaerochaeta sp.]MDD3058642.1 CvpA family protein [Sphaerochaeta sp.]MDD3928452.1 CvpA family protein [Sphaerochaeta sp.]NCC12430.1 CvpA family protein [Spirochaetia bacterium]NCC88883.1 CvpA family protein [Spirochaetia bacterium]